jgi:type VI secretion system secreted protein Hcp
MGLLDSVIGFAQKAAPVVQRAISKLKSSGGSAADYFLKIEGLEGESADEAHKGEIEVAAFELGAAQVGSGGSGGGSGTGKVQFDDFTFTAKVSKASPTLLLSCAIGRHFPKATFLARKAGEGQQEYLKITLTDVLISGYRNQDQGEGDPVPVDVVSLNFAEIDFEFKPQNSDGSLGGAIKSGFNLKKNVKK